MNQDNVNKIVLEVIVASVSALFFSMIYQFLMAIFLAGLFSALARPIYRRLNVMFGGRRHAASLTTLLLVIVVVLIPMLILGGLIVGQAIDVGQTVVPWVKQNLAQPDQLSSALVALMTDARRRQAMGLAGQRVVDENRGARAALLARVKTVLEGP